MPKSTIPYTNTRKETLLKPIFNTLLCLTLGAAALQGAILDDLVEKIEHETAARKHHTAASHHAHRKRHRVHARSEEKQWQEALKFMGYYHGKIDGDLYTHASYDAIQHFQEKRQDLSTGFLEQPAKTYLSYIDRVLTLEHYLTKNATHRRGKRRQLQAALAMEGFYHGRIDGRVGKGTKRAIRRYKAAAGLNGSNRATLNGKEKEALIREARRSAEMQLKAFREEERFYSIDTSASDETNRSIVQPEPISPEARP